MKEIKYDGISFNADNAASISEAAFVEAFKDEPMVAEKWPNRTEDGIVTTLKTVHKMCCDMVKNGGNDNLSTTGQGGEPEPDGPIDGGSTGQSQAGSGSEQKATTRRAGKGRGEAE